MLRKVMEVSYWIFLIVSQERLVLPASYYAVIGFGNLVLIVQSLNINILSYSKAAFLEFTST